MKSVGKLIGILLVAGLFVLVIFNPWLLAMPFVIALIAITAKAVK